MWKELTNLWDSIRDPEYLHLLIEPLPLYGLGAGLLFLLLSVMTRESKSKLLALLLITLSCASVWWYEDLRQTAAPRILATRDPSLGPLIREQSERRRAHYWVYYLMAGVSAVTLVLQASGKGKPLVFLILVGGLALLWFSIWLHKKECEVYHRNIVKQRAPT